MTYSELISTDDISFTLPASVNENFRKRSFLNIAAMSATFVVWADDTAGSPKDIYLVTTGVGAVTIDGNASETINGATTVAITATQFHYRTIMCDGTNWVVISSS